MLTRLLCLLLGHALDENSVNSYAHTLRHCVRCNHDVRVRLASHRR